MTYSLVFVPALYDNWLSSYSILKSRRSSVFLWFLQTKCPHRDSIFRLWMKQQTCSGTLVYFGTLPIRWNPLSHLFQPPPPPKKKLFLAANNSKTKRWQRHLLAIFFLLNTGRTGRLRPRCAGCTGMRAAYTRTAS